MNHTTEKIADAGTVYKRPSVDPGRSDNRVMSATPTQAAPIDSPARPTPDLAADAAPAGPDEAAVPNLTALMRSPPRRVPVTVALVVANIAVFVVMLFFGAGLWHTSNGVQLSWGANFGPATKDGEWWRLGSAMFLHFGFVHLAMNMWGLWDCGRLTERLYGSTRFAFIYVLSGLVGNLVSLVVQGDRAVSGGASGAIFGVFGALLVCLARERRQVDPAEFRWLFWGGAVFALASLGLGFVITGIDNAAHVGGLLSGALLGSGLGRALKRERPVVAWHRAVAFAALVGATALFAFNIPAPRYRMGEELQARTAIRQFLDDEQRIGDRWQAIMSAGKSGNSSFEDLAGHIDADVSRGYQDSFEQLSSIALSPAAPSAADLEFLKKYALLRGDAAHALADALRSKDATRIRRALDAMRQAPALAKAASAPAP
ncbi:MAG: rhomboid family intramembrane serine protease [Caldimonas sp.]